MRPQFTNLILKFYSTQSGNEAPVMLFRRDKMQLLSNQLKPYCGRAPFMGVKKCYNYLFLPDVELIFVNDIRSVAVKFSAATRLDVSFELHSIPEEMSNQELIDRAHELFETPPAKPSSGGGERCTVLPDGKKFVPGQIQYVGATFKIRR